MSEPYNRDMQLPPGFSHWEPLTKENYFMGRLWGYYTQSRGTFYVINHHRRSPIFNAECDYYGAVLKPGYSLRVAENGKTEAKLDPVPPMTRTQNYLIQSAAAGLDGHAERVFYVANYEEAADRCAAIERSLEDPSPLAVKIMEELRRANDKKLSVRETAEHIINALSA